jgi:hypothetical protein
LSVLLTYLEQNETMRQIAACVRVW